MLDITLEGENFSVHVRERSHSLSWREFTAKPRIYVGVEPFDLLEDLENRFRRPHAAFRAELPKVFSALAVDMPKVVWSQKAGCSCGCSPGFIVQGCRIAGCGYWDMWLTLRGVDSVDLKKPARLVFA